MLAGTTNSGISRISSLAFAFTTCTFLLRDALGVRETAVGILTGATELPQAPTLEDILNVVPEIMVRSILLSK
jgi:hypothetical protein